MTDTGLTTVLQKQLKLPWWGTVVVPRRLAFTLTHIPPGQNGRHFADNNFQGIFLNENVWNSLKISLQCVPKFRINRLGADQASNHYLNQCWPSSLTHICGTRGQRSFVLFLFLSKIHFQLSKFVCEIATILLHAILSQRLLCKQYCGH